MAEHNAPAFLSTTELQSFLNGKSVEDILNNAVVYGEEQLLKQFDLGHAEL